MYCINQKSIITLFIRERRKINDHIKFQPYNLIKFRRSESATASAFQTFREAVADLERLILRYPMYN